MKPRPKFECGHCSFLASTPDAMTRHLEVHSETGVEECGTKPIKLENALYDMVDACHANKEMLEDLSVKSEFDSGNSTLHGSTTSEKVISSAESNVRS